MKLKKLSYLITLSAGFIAPVALVSCGEVKSASENQVKAETSSDNTQTNNNSGSASVDVNTNTNTSTNTGSGTETNTNTNVNVNVETGEAGASEGNAGASTSGNAGTTTNSTYPVLSELVTYAKGSTDHTFKQWLILLRNLWNNKRSETEQAVDTTKEARAIAGNQMYDLFTSAAQLNDSDMPEDGAVTVRVGHGTILKFNEVKDTVNNFLTALGL
ncbi:hypothetical protein ACJA23_01145 [Mycoplasma corogypsi]|uniref:hypothetical protein n=1 Tax=Mycoplasma corogypsi TaxID=2106 RepID=UPI003873A433